MEANYIHPYLDKKTAELLDRALKETNMSISGFVREALNEKFQRMGLIN